MPGYISLCYQTICAHNADVRLLNRTGFDALFHHDRYLDIDSIPVHHRSDFIRCYLVRHYGGIYLDLDCIMLRSLSPILDHVHNYGFVGYRQPDGTISNNFLASAPYGMVISNLYARICSRLLFRHPLVWCELGSCMLGEIEKSNPGWYLLPTEQVMPLPWFNSERLAECRSDDEHEQHFHPDAFCYMLTNENIKNLSATKVLFHSSEEDIINGKYFMSFLFRKALRKEGVPC
jgi:hypothetical protein